MSQNEAPFVSFPSHFNLIFPHMKENKVIWDPHFVSLEQYELIFKMRTNEIKWVQMSSDEAKMRTNESIFSGPLGLKSEMMKNDEEFSFGSIL